MFYLIYFILCKLLYVRLTLFYVMKCSLSSFYYIFILLINYQFTLHDAHYISVNTVIKSVINTVINSVINSVINTIINSVITIVITLSFFCLTLL